MPRKNEEDFKEETKVHVDREEAAGGWEERRAKSHDIVWAWVLIFAGITFLLNNTGVIPWAIWGELWRFWPILLVLGGLRLVLGRGRTGEAIVGLVTVFSLVVILAYALRAVGSPLVPSLGLDKLPAFPYLDQNR
ncbi:DUF5668 domain-containing protein [Patescibacteria group bacterium]|nr:DUF5668 domain-containing protein [Patescibacteria group bacterium]